MVNNAALTYYVPDKRLSVEPVDAVLGGQFPRPLPAQQAGFGRHGPTGSGSIVNISSGAAVGPGRGPYPDAPPNSGGTCYGAEKAALERFSQGLAQEVYQFGVSVTSLAPSQIVATPGTVFHNLVTRHGRSSRRKPGIDDQKRLSYSQPSLWTR